MSVPQVADAAASPAELTPAPAAAPGGPAVPAPRPPGQDRTAPRYALSLAVILQILISAGDGLAMVALASRVYQTSHASWAVASVFLAVTVPITALAPVAGMLLDRLSPRPLLVAAAAAETVRRAGPDPAHRHRGHPRAVAWLRRVRGPAPARAGRHRPAAGRPGRGHPGQRLPAGGHLGRVHRGPAARPGCSPQPAGPAWRWAPSPRCTAWARSGCACSRCQLASRDRPAAPPPRAPRAGQPAGRSAPGCASCALTVKQGCWCWWSRSWWPSATWPAWRRWPSPRVCSGRVPRATRCSWPPGPRACSAALWPEAG